MTSPTFKESETQDLFKTLDKFLKDINPLIQEYMKENSIDIVLEKNQIFVGNKNKDITLDIIELINKRLTNDG